VRVRVDWLGVPQGAEGEVLGIAFRNPVTYLVRFPGGRHLIPVVHLERVRRTSAPARPHLVAPPGLLVGADAASRW